MRLRTLQPRRALPLAAMLAALLLVGAGCSKPATPATPPAQQPVPSPSAGRPTPAPAPAPQPEAMRNCSNPYYPLKNGLSIEYQTTTGKTVSTYVTSVSEVTADSAKLTFFFPEKKLTIDQDVTCVNGSIRTGSFMNLGAAGQMKTETKSVEGDLMPRDLAPGSTWSTKYKVLATVAGREMTMDVASEAKVIGEEQVTVPAGTFTALKVEETTTNSFVIPGVPAMKPTVSVTTQWWVRDVGAVKMVTPAPEGDTVTVATKVTNP